MAAVRLTRADFMRQCAEARLCTVEELRAAGYVAVPCACGADVCTGWALEHREHA